MKTAERNSRIRWADMFSVCANGTAGRNRRCSSTWGWKQEKLQRWERYFLLTSPSRTTYRNTLQIRPLQDSHTAHVSLAVHTVAAVPAKTANKPLIKTWVLIRNSY